MSRFFIPFAKFGSRHFSTAADTAKSAMSKVSADGSAMPFVSFGGLISLMGMNLYTYQRLDAKVDGLRTETNAKIDGLRAELRTDSGEIKADIKNLESLLLDRVLPRVPAPGSAPAPGAAK